LRRNRRAKIRRGAAIPAHCAALEGLAVRAALIAPVAGGLLILRARLLKTDGSATIFAP